MTKQEVEQKMTLLMTGRAAEKRAFDPLFSRIRPIKQAQPVAMTPALSPS